MKVVVTGLALAVITFVNVAASAQTSPSLTGPKPNLGAVPAAPVGHRQPKAGDVPKDSKNDTQADLDAADRALDKKIRSICRGC